MYNNINDLSFLDIFEAIKNIPFNSRQAKAEDLLYVSLKRQRKGSCCVKGSWAGQQTRPGTRKRSNALQAAKSSTNQAELNNLTLFQLKQQSQFQDPHRIPNTFLLMKNLCSKNSVS